VQRNVLSVSMPGPLVELVRQEATASDRPVSRVVAEAVRSWVKQKEADDHGR
jgi:hypothetical protein